MKRLLNSSGNHAQMFFCRRCFADVNCRLGVAFKDGTSIFFNHIDNLKSLMNNRS